ncbi:MAG: NADH-quinone oxidoreductase subunit L [Colwellia sp.]|nr:NADH-quinone oxidoreductase subunit L [Colwellia sp.]
MTETVLAFLPFYPLISFVLLILLGKRLSWRLAASLSIGAMVLSVLSSLFVISQLSVDIPVITSHLWTWFTLSLAEGANQANQSAASININFYLDGLSAVMISVVTGIGLLIHIYAAAYMKADENFSRFMAYMNLFIVAMLILVLADNLVLLYLGWEGVGLCSFLLIGFWYKEKTNVLAARKAFIVTRVGDTALAIGLFMLFKELGQLTIVDISQNAQMLWLAGDDKPYWIALLLLGGAVGKSAQLPLQTWLPDAMAGPTPVSALIHAATMVTAGVYLIARMNGLFLLAPEVMNYVAWLGAATLLVAGIAALAQSDIKRVLAYSTMSQIGYMMLSLGAGAFSAGVFHLMTHAFFKALLFLTAGAIIAALHHQQNLFKMGGLLKRLPFESALFAVGLVCLMALPGSSGFFSKEAIIAQLWSSDTAGPLLWYCAIFGALLTSIYSCRLFFLAFMGESRFKENLQPSSSKLLKFSLMALAVLSLIGGMFANIIEISLAEVFPLDTGIVDSEPYWLHSVAIATPFVGIVFSWCYFSAYRSKESAASNKNIFIESSNGLAIFCRQGLGFDNFYHCLLVKPYCYLAQLNRRDIFDQLIMLNTWYVGLCYDVLKSSQTGKLRWYAAAIGLVTFLLLLVLTVDVISTEAS